jgi:alanyl-tRNA synthetase
MVELTITLYRVDPYQKEFDASVIRVEPNFIVLDQTCFYPQGGGQAGDTGEISGHRVVNTIIDGEEIRHITQDTPHLTAGQTVHGVIDWEQRYRIMRLHSAAHLVYYSMQEVFGAGCKPASSGMLDEVKDRSDYTFNEPLDKTKLAIVEEKVNNLITEALPITHNLEQGSGERLLWKVPPYPAMACGGTHVHNTDEIGRINLKRGSKPGKGRERIELTLV